MGALLDLAWVACNDMMDILNISFHHGILLQGVTIKAVGYLVTGKGWIRAKISESSAVINAYLKSFQD